MLLHSPHNLLPFIWLRFSDDIFMLWRHGSTALTMFLQHINSFHPTIKFSHKQSHTSINFLETTILLTEQRTLQSILYIKPADKGLLLHHASHNPTACKKGIIYSQALRYQRIITNDHDLRQHLQRLHKILSARGYSHPHQRCIQQLSHLTHTKSTTPTQATTATAGAHLPFVLAYNTDLPPISHILRHNWHLTQNDPSLSQLFPRQPFLSYTRHKNLLRICWYTADSPHTKTLTLTLPLTTLTQPLIRKTPNPPHLPTLQLIHTRNKQPP